MVIGIILVTGASLTASLLMLQVAVLPLLFKYNKSVQRKMIFSNCFNYPRNLDYENPASCNIIGGRNFSITFQSKIDNCPIKLAYSGRFAGVWHMVPCSRIQSLFLTEDYGTVHEIFHQELRTTSNNVVLYFHGNSNNRGSPERLQMYKIFQELDFHVIAFDYRGYGDSTYVRPTERGVVEDAVSVYSWLVESLESIPRPTILLWGHSLGTAVAANMALHLREIGAGLGKEALPEPDALVLEAPFNNLADEIECHPFSKLVSWLPYFKNMFVKPFCDSTEYAFTTDQYLVAKPDLPILILHSKEDKIVPHELAAKLHKAIIESRKESGGHLVFHSFDKGLGIGHNNIWKADDLKSIITNFLKMTKKTAPDNQT